MIAPRPFARLGPGPFLVAHRGVPAAGPENAAAALVAAREAGAPVVELDARPAFGDLLVVLHDATPARLTGERLPAASLPAPRLLEQPLLADPDDRLLLLDEALALLAGRTVVDIELKPEASVGAGEIARRLLAALERAGDPEGVVVTSESVEVLREVRSRAPLLATGLVFRSRSRGDAVERALAAAAGLIVANRRRVDPELIARARERGLPVWAYTVNDAREARRLFDLGCAAVVTDRYPGLAAELGAQAPAPRLPPGPETLLAIDIGSTASKAALVDPERGIVALRSSPTPTRTPKEGWVEHDPEETLRTVLRLVEDLARSGADRPRAAALAVQRSTVLLADRRLTPLSFAISWQDRRGEGFVAGMPPGRRAALEREAGLPLAAAWSGVKGRWLFGAAGKAGRDALLLPLGCWLAARLTGEPPWVDPTLANRTFLVSAATGRWSEALRETLELPESALPPIRPSVGDRGTLPWRDGRVPLLAVIGDQQAAYVGAAGPLGERLVINLGTAAFVMRAYERPPGVEGARVAPLWTSDRRPAALRYLVEFPVKAPSLASVPIPAGGDGSDRFSRAVARAVALGDSGPGRFCRDLADRAARLIGPRDRTIVLSGGGTKSPHLVALLRRTLPLPPVLAAESELTLLGAARLAAAAAGLPWAVPPAGGLAPPTPPGV